MKNPDRLDIGDDELSPLTRRLLGDTGRVVSEYDRGRDLLVTARVGELLCRKQDARELDKELRDAGGTPGASLFDEIDNLPGLEESDREAADVELWRFPGEVDVLSLARDLRARRLSDGRNPEMAPNHVTVPARPHVCPGAPPSPATDTLPFPSAKEGESVKVVVIDTPDTGHPDLASRVSAEWGFYLDQAGKWKQEPVNANVDLLNANNDSFLDAVAGHGSFVAGIIAHHCPQAEITVVGHHELEVAAVELSVARSILNHADADVISCGFAFPTLDGAESLAFNAALAGLDPTTVVVSPAGNSTSTAPHYPAAFGRVVGVGATDGNGNRAPFSNYGGWVDCCTNGVDILGPHVWFEGASEDAPTGPSLFEGWSRWSGTSFSTPRISAAIASQMATGGGTARQALFELLHSQVPGVQRKPRADMRVELVFS